MRALLSVACVLFALNASAQSVNDMVQQLQAAPRTRSLSRNLVVAPAEQNSPAQEATPAQPRAAISLQIQFDFNSDRVKAESVPLIDDLSRALLAPQLSSAKFAIEGHTDAKGRADYNMKLSERRAFAVRNMLVERGVETQRLVASGKGSTELANPANPQAPENRRVRVVNLE